MAVRKPTAADRPQFRRDMLDMMQTLKVGVAEIAPDMAILCTPADEWDPSHNVLWEEEANKSAVREEVHCAGCKKPVAMSNHAYERYTMLDKKPVVVCIRCVADNPSLLK
jgi:hypothetical protein